MSAAAATPAALSLRGMSKAFGGTLALNDVSFDLPRGEVLALLGQNGAGKSTVIKLLAGVYRADRGEVLLDGAAHDPRTAKNAIAFIHQDLGLLEWMTVAENIAMAQGYPRRRGLIDWPQVEAMARKSLSMIAYDIDPRPAHFRPLAHRKVTRRHRACAGCERACADPRRAHGQPAARRCARALRCAAWPEGTRRDDDVRVAPARRGVRDCRQPGRAARRAPGGPPPDQRGRPRKPDRHHHRPPP